MKFSVVSRSIASLYALRLCKLAERQMDHRLRRRVGSEDIVSQDDCAMLGSLA